MKRTRWLADRIRGVLFYSLAALSICLVAPTALQLYNAYYIFEASTVVVHGSLPSPDGKHVAVIYEVEGGATSPFNTQVSVAPAKRSFSREENPSFLSLKGQYELPVRWLGEQTIEIGIPDDTTIFRAETRAGDITVVYRTGGARPVRYLENSATPDSPPAR